MNLRLLLKVTLQIIINKIPDLKEKQGAIMTDFYRKYLEG